MDEIDFLAERFSAMGVVANPPGRFRDDHQLFVLEKELEPLFPLFFAEIFDDLPLFDPCGAKSLHAPVDAAAVFLQRAPDPLSRSSRPLLQKGDELLPPFRFPPLQHHFAARFSRNSTKSRTP
jgi:hypothetical protein